MKKILFTITCLYLMLVTAAQESPVQKSDSVSQQTGRILISGYGDDASIPLSSTVLTSKWRIAGDIGFSYRTAKIVEGIDGRAKDFLRKMRSGMVYGADIHYFLNHSFGIGAKFSGHSYSHSEGSISGVVNTLYFAPSVIWRSYDRNYRNALIWCMSLGYLVYKEELKTDNKPYNTKKGGVGMIIDLGYDIKLFEGAALGFKLSLTNGFVNLGMKDKNGDKVLESLSAIELSTGLRF